MKKRIDIIGGGISGLASAYFLAKGSDDVDIHVWEKDETAGGLAGSFSTPHFTVEKFYHHLYRRDLALQELISEMGLSNDLIWRAASTGSYYRQQPYRLSSPLDLLRYKPLPFFDRLRLGAMMLDARRYKSWHELDDMPAKDYVTRVAGESVYRTVWEPLFQGKFGPYADSISAAWLWAKLVDRGGSRSGSGKEVLGYLRGGLGRLFDELILRLQHLGHTIHLGARVKQLETDGSAIRGIVTDSGFWETDYVISGAQVPDLARLLPESAYRSSLEKIQFLGNVCLVLTLNRSLSSFYWTNVTDVSFPFVGIIEQTNWAQPDEFQGRRLVYISAYVPPSDPRMAMTADQLFEVYLPHIQRMFPSFTRSYVENTSRWNVPYAQPVVQTGFRHLVPKAETPIPNLFVCTMAQIYPSDRQVSNGVEMARKTANALLEKLTGKEAGHAVDRYSHIQ